MIAVNSSGEARVVHPLEYAGKRFVARTDFEKFEACLDCALMAQNYFDDNIQPEAADFPGIDPLPVRARIMYHQLLAITQDAWRIFTRKAH
jgi:hypothetical protein